MVGVIMITSNILDVNGNIIGTLEMPDGTDPTVIAAQLAMYASAPPPVIVPTVASQVITTLSSLPVYSSDSNAIAAGMSPGQLYNNNGVVTIIQPVSSGR